MYTDLVKLIENLDLLDSSALASCNRSIRGLSQGKERDRKALKTIASQEFLPQEQLLYIVGIYKNCTFQCPECDQDYPGKNFQDIKELQCESCGELLMLDDDDRQNLVLSLGEIAEEAAREEERHSSYRSKSQRLRKEKDLPFQVGEVLLDQYHIKKLLGQGGMGAVYLGYDKPLRREVAIKVISPKLKFEEEDIARFQREARASAQLTHPNIVQTYNYTEVAGKPLIIFEYVDGCDLYDLIIEEGTLSAPKTLDIALQVAEGLNYAHKKYILHRDLKPENIMISREGEAKIGDFGLSKIIGGSMLTKSGIILGTPYYMPPEQAKAQEVDGRCDIYALGATMYHCLFGYPPFIGKTFMEVVKKQIHNPLEFPDDYRGRYPESLFELMEKMMAKETWRRQENCQEVIEDLKSVLADLDNWNPNEFRYILGPDFESTYSNRAISIPSEEKDSPRKSSSQSKKSQKKSSDSTEENSKKRKGKLPTISIFGKEDSDFSVSVWLSSFSESLREETRTTWILVAVVVILLALVSVGVWFVLWG